MHLFTSQKTEQNSSWYQVLYFPFTDFNRFVMIYIHVRGTAPIFPVFKLHVILNYGLLYIFSLWKWSLFELVFLQGWVLPFFFLLHATFLVVAMVNKFVYYIAENRNPTIKVSHSQLAVSPRLQKHMSPSFGKILLLKFIN